MSETSPPPPGSRSRDPKWLLHADGFDPRRARHDEGLFTQGSGYLHLRGSLEEALADAPQDADPLREPANVSAEAFPELAARWGAFVPGVFADHPLLGHELVNLPFFLGWSLRVEGEVFDVTRSELLRHHRDLDLRDGLLRRELGWKTRSGAELCAIFERFVSAAHPHVCLQRLQFHADRDLEVEVASFVDANVRTNGFDHFTRVECRAVDERDVACRLATNGGDEVEMISRFLHGQHHAAGSSAGRLGEVAIQRELAGDGEPLVLEKRTAIATSRDRGFRPVSELLAELSDLAWEELLARHRGVWAARWEACEVEVVGDPRSRLALRTSLYHLLRSHVPDDPRVAIDAKGFAGEAYYGRFFWDTEMSLLPFFLYTLPEKARTLVDFRRSTLEGARQNAAAEGRAGARYPWESSTTGVEQCPAWPYNEEEIHVTADVVYGWAHYARAADPRYLPEVAGAIVETGRYWLDRIEETAKGTLRLSGVLGPDEYTPTTTNNAFTNRMVSFALECAAEIGARGGASEEERERFRDCARRLPIPRGKDPRLVLQCEGFEELEDPQFETRWLDRTRPIAAQVELEVLYRTKALKQADVLALMQLFPGDFTLEEVRAAWEYYLPFTTHDSSLSGGIHCLIACRLGLSDEAWQYWLSSRDLDTDPYTSGAAEGIHIANAAATWMGVVMGFAGLESAMWAEALTLEPRLPAAWGRLSFPLVWRGTPVRVELTREATRVTNCGEAALVVCVAGEEREIEPAGCELFPTGREPAPKLAAALFDLDGVLVTTDRLHFEAWSELARREGLSFDWETNHLLRGVSRRRSLEILLERAGATVDEGRMEEMMSFKNERYRAKLATLGPADVLPGARELLAALRGRGVPTAIVSASRNAPLILERVGLREAVDVLVDGSNTARSKPDPEGYLLAAGRLGVEPTACLVIEDAPAGVEAARRAGAAVLAIGDPSLHPNVPCTVRGLAEVTAEDLEAMAKAPLP